MHSGIDQTSGAGRRGALALLWLWLVLLAKPATAQTPRVIAFRAPITYTGSAGSLLRPADWDGDGRLDLTVVTPVGLTFRYGNGDGTFGSPVHLPLGGGLHEGVPVDLNRDGALDLAICNNALGKVLVLLNQGNRTFAPAVHHPVQSEPVAIIAADFNSDGAPDLAVTNHRSNSFSVLLNRGDGALQPAIHYGGASYPGGIASADFNHDGKLDIAQANLVSNVVRVFFGDGAGRFQFSGQYPTNDDYSNVLVIDDYNGDGALDMAVGCLDGIALLFGDGSGAFSPPINYGGPLTNSLDGGDLDGDGDPDLVAAKPGSGFFIHQNHEAGNLLPAAPGPAEAEAGHGVRVGDFDGDGRPDIAASSAASPSILIFLNDTPRPAPAVRSLAVAPASIIGGCETATGEVTLAAPAPAGGAEIALRSSNAAVTVPLAIVVPAGAARARFSVGAAAVNQTQASSLSATYNGTASRTIVTVRPGAPTTLRFQPGQVVGGQPVVVEMTFGCPVGPGALALAVASSNPAVVVAPAVVPVAPGATRVTFTITTAAVTAPTTVTLFVSGPGVAASAVLPVLPAPLPVGNYLINGSFEDPGNSPHGTRSLPGWRVLEGTIDLVPWPPAPGQGRQSLDLVGTPGAGTIEQTFATEPGRLYTFSGWLSRNPGVSEGRANVSIDGQFLVQLYHNTPLAEGDMKWQPFSYTFRANASSTTLRLKDVTGLWDGGGGAALDGLVVLPTDPSNVGPPPAATLTLQLTPATVTGGVQATGRLTLSAPAPSGGIAFALTSSNPAAATAPAIVALAAGATSASFPVTTFAVASPSIVTLTAAGAGLTGATTLQVLPPSAGPYGNLLINGSFEEPRVPPVDGIGLRGDRLPGWRIPRGTVDVVPFPEWQPAPGEGRQCLDLVGLSPGAIEQSFVTTPGREYLFAGWMSHNADNPVAPEGRADVFLNGQFFVRLFHRDALTRRNDMRWVRFAYRFRAVAPTTTLTLVDVTNTWDAGGGLFLDGLVVVDAGEAPPSSSPSTPSDPSGPPVMPAPEQPAPGAPPSTTASRSPEPNADGWNNSDAVLRLHATPGEGGAAVDAIRFTLSGAQSGGDTVAGSDAELTITAEGTTTVGYAARSTDGASEPPRTLMVRIDRTPPVVTYTGNAGRYTVDQPIAIRVSATDRLSGVATSDGEAIVGPAYTLDLGEHRFEATATDRAGNTGTGSTTFRVEVTYESLSALVRQLVPNAKVATALCRRLETARKAGARGASPAEARALAAFTRAVKQQRGRTLTAAQVELLVRLGAACRGTAGR